jgi:magnesium-transporting ATPase (P-type)
VGQIVRVNKDEGILADMVCIAAPKDIVYVSTMNLDGETNLKERTLPFVEVTLESLSLFVGHIVCDQPNESLEHWDGNVHSNFLKQQIVNCNIKNTLLRGCTLKNTEYCLKL